MGRVSVSVCVSVCVCVSSDSCPIINLSTSLDDKSIFACSCHYRDSYHFEFFWEDLDLGILYLSIKFEIDRFMFMFSTINYCDSTNVFVNVFIFVFMNDKYMYMAVTYKCYITLTRKTFSAQPYMERVSDSVCMHFQLFLSENRFLLVNRSSSNLV